MQQQSCTHIELPKAPRRLRYLPMKFPTTFVSYKSGTRRLSRSSLAVASGCDPAAMTDLPRFRNPSISVCRCVRLDDASHDLMSSDCEHRPAVFGCVCGSQHDSPITVLTAVVLRQPRQVGAPLNVDKVYNYISLKIYISAY